jgi:hypothetical protein
MAACIFCDEPAGNTEHVFPRWILDRKDMGKSRLTFGNRPGLVLDKTHLTVKTVCETCNNHWMNDLEGEVKPILSPIFDDQAFSINEQQQTVLAVWVTKVAFLLDSTKGRNAANRFYTKPEGVALRVHRQIPQMTRIWIGRLDATGRVITGTDFGGPSEVGRVTGCVTTMTNEHFVAQIVSLHLDPTPVVPVSVRVEPKPGEWDLALSSISPIEQASISWPPRYSFTNTGQSAFAYLLDRWRLGEEKKPTS